MTWCVITACILVLIALLFLRFSRPASTKSLRSSVLEQSEISRSAAQPTMPSTLGLIWMMAVQNQRANLIQVFNTYNNMNLNFKETFIILNDLIEVTIEVPQVQNVMRIFFQSTSAEMFVDRLSTALLAGNVRVTTDDNKVFKLHFKTEAGVVGLPGSSVTTRILTSIQNCSEIKPNIKDCSFPSRQCSNCSTPCESCGVLNFKCHGRAAKCHLRNTSCAANFVTCQPSRFVEEGVNSGKRIKCKGENTVEEVAAASKRSVCETKNALIARAQSLSKEMASSILREGIAVKTYDLTLTFRVLENTEIHLDNIKIETDMSLAAKRWWLPEANMIKLFNNHIKPRIETNASTAMMKAMRNGINSILQ